jgi:hypothetical protein
VDPTFEVRGVAVHAAVVDDGDIRDESERAAEDLIDNTIMPIRFIDGRDDEYDLDAVAGSNRVYSPHLARNFTFIAGAQGTVGFSERVFILNDEWSLEYRGAIPMNGTHP